MTTEKPKTPRKAPAKPRAAKVKDKLAPMIAEAPSAEEAEVRRTRLKTLIALGKERGYLTYAEINDHLPDDLVDAEQIESIISTFNDMGIQVFDVAPAAEDLLMSEVAPTVVDDEQAEAEAEQTLSAVDSNSAAPPTRSACTCARWAPSNSSPAKAKSRSPSASRKASST
jgi:RNA polymerase primary sigma factor